MWNESEPWPIVEKEPQEEGSRNKVVKEGKEEGGPKINRNFSV